MPKADSNNSTTPSGDTASSHKKVASSRKTPPNARAGHQPENQTEKSSMRKTATAKAAPRSLALQPSHQSTFLVASTGTNAPTIAPALPVAQDAAASRHPDAELLKLVDRLWSLLPRYRKIYQRYEREEARWFKRRPHARAEEDSTFAAARTPYDEIWKEIGSLQRQAWEIHAQSLEGIQAKARWHLEFFCDGRMDQLGCKHEAVAELFQELAYGANASVQDVKPSPDPDAVLFTADDPIFAAIEIHRAALANHLAAVETEAIIEEKWSRDEKLHDVAYREACRATTDASRAADRAAMTLLNVEPTTVAGAAALLNYVSAATRQTFPEFDDTGERLSFENEIGRRVGKALGKIPTTAPAMVRPVTTSRDPIFAAIEAHRRAERAYRSDCRGPDTRANDRKSDRLRSKEMEAMAQLQATMPTTLKGLSALLGHLHGYVELEDREGGDMNTALNHLTLFSTLAKAAAALSEH